jgi:hypothetical protein
MLRFRNVADDSKDALLWSLKAGAATTLAEFGNPLGTDDYELCAYDESSPALLFRAVVAGGGTCDGQPCWNASGQRMLRYRSSTSPEGVTIVLLKSGPDGGTRAVVKAKGLHLSDHPAGLPVPPVALPLRVQLHGSSGLCLETRHTAASVVKNDAGSGVFKARGAP